MEPIADLLKAARAYNYASQSPPNDDGEHHASPAGEIRIRAWRG